LTFHLDDHSIDITTTGGATFTLPIGPMTLLDGPLERADPPLPAHLTNALGLVADHLDDVIIAAPSVMASSAVIATGRHAEALARVEIGDHRIPPGYRLQRSDADEVFRTLAVESVADRRHNPGLDDDHVESIVATCCVILGVMRRLDLDSIGIDSIGIGVGSDTVDASATRQAAH
jgi:exopolyphosphatase/guanosine-5'-triphosphate,3'-diphosphate pyrophosphatase